MRGKNTSKDAKIKRMQQLADIKGTQNVANESKTSNLGTLISFKKANNGINYGIIKENKNYYIKKGGKKEAPDVFDFTYIGGLGNKTDYQYKNLAEADKNMNMVLQSINETESLKLDNNRSKMLHEQKEESVEEKNNEVDDEEERREPESPEEKIEKAEDALEKVEDKTEKDVESDPVDTEVPDLDKPDEFPDLEMPGEEAPGEEAPEEETPEEETPGDDDLPDLDDLDLGDEEGEEKPEKEPSVDEPSEDEPSKGEPSEEDDSILLGQIKSKLGKLNNLISSVPMESSKIQEFTKSFLTTITKKDNFDDIDVKERKKMSDMVMKTIEADDDELAAKIAADERMVDEEKEKCAECGDFKSFMESKGYTLEGVLECGNDEMATNISEYANAYYEGVNDGDFENMSLYSNDEINKTLSEEFGHDEYVKEMNECGDKKIYENKEDRVAQLSELWGGSKQDESYDTAHVETQPNLKTDQSDVLNEEDGDEEKESDFEDKEKESDFSDDSFIDFTPDADNLGAGVVKPDTAPTTSTDINVDAENKTINIAMNEQKLRKYVQKRIQMIKEGKISLNESKNKTVNEIDNMIREELNEQKIRKYVRERLLEKRGLKKPKINESKKSSKLKKLDEMIDMEYDNHEKETKLRKYVRNRLEEMTGKRKPVLNENKKSDKLKKLDKMIAEQFDMAKKLYEGSTPRKSKNIDGVTVYKVDGDFEFYIPSGMTGDKFKAWKNKNKKEIDDFKKTSLKE